MSEARLRIAFEGPGVEDGSIDVRDLAPALLALGQLVQAAAAVLNGDRAQTSVRLLEVDDGSFIADLAIIQSIGEMLKELFAFSEAHKEGVEAASGLADLIFKVGGGVAGVGVGLFQLMKLLKGKKPEKAERLANGEISITAQDGATVIVNQKVERLYADMLVRKAAESVAQAAQSEGVERLKFTQGDEADSAPFVIERAEAPYFALPAPPGEAEVIGDQERVMNLQIRNAWFTGESQKWGFTEGGQLFPAVIEDTAFLNRVAKGEISLGANDYMSARVRVRQTMTRKGLKVEHTILEVLDYKSGDRQLQLL